MSAARMTAPTARAMRKIRTGVVISNKMQKTIVVQVARLVRHPQYSRVVAQASTFKVHDETNSAAIGDLVKIMETRPLSKEKCWRLVEVVRRAADVPPVPEADVTHATGGTAPAVST